MAEKPWADLTPAEKRAVRIERWRNPGLEFQSPEAEADFKARIDRLIKAVSLEKPDRVPVNLTCGFWPAVRAGMTAYDAMSDPVRAGQVNGFEFVIRSGKGDTVVDPARFFTQH